MHYATSLFDNNIKITPSEGDQHLQVEAVPVPNPWLSQLFRTINTDF